MIDTRDRSSFLLDAYADRQKLVAWVASQGVDHARAEDIVHEAYARLIHETDIDHAPDRPGAWLHTVCRNLLISGARRDAVAVRRERTGLDARTDDPEAEAVRRSNARDLAAALAEISPDARRALVLAAEGYSGAEIAARLGRTPEAVRTLICRTRAALREALTTRASSAVP